MPRGTILAPRLLNSWLRAETEGDLRMRAELENLARPICVSPTKQNVTVSFILPIGRPRGRSTIEIKVVDFLEPRACARLGQKQKLICRHATVNPD